jgi:hypothetical protein
VPHRILALTLATAFVALYSTAFAGGPAPVATTPAYEDSPSLAVAPVANRALVVYEVRRGRNTDVAAALLDAKTGAVLKRFGIDGGPFDQAQPVVAYGNGGFLVLYVDCTDADCTAGKATLRKVSTTGVRGKITVLKTSADPLADPALAANPTSNTYLAAWSREVAEGTADIEGAVYTAGGKLVKAFSNRLGADADAAQALGVAAANTKNGGYLLAFREDRATVVNVAARTVSAKGTLGRIRPVDEDLETTLPAIVYNSAANTFLVTFEIEVAGGVFARMFNAATGRPMGDRVEQVSLEGDGETCSAVGFSPSQNRYLVTYTGLRPIDEFDRFFELEGMRLNRAGKPVGTTEVAFGEGETGCSAVAWSEPAKAFLVAWDQTDADFENSDVWARVCRAKTAC